jgi:hypothetical protein
METKDNIKEMFLILNKQNWKEVLFDSGTESWKENWFLDGKKALIKNTVKGMNFSAGPTFKDDSCHAVLWTRKEYEGDIRIEYDYTRLDSEKRCVNILYLQATGSGEEPYDRDISKWNQLREIPAMKMYFDHMNTYHISYAAYGNTNEIVPGYIRARRYMASGLEGTTLEPDYDPDGFFETGVPHKITVIKSGNNIYFKISNDKRELICHWHNTRFPSVNKGRIGLRHMYTRSSLYGNFRIFQLEN